MTNNLGAIAWRHMVDWITCKQNSITWELINVLLRDFVYKDKVAKGGFPRFWHFTQRSTCEMCRKYFVPNSYGN